jgi:hypothetical protein
LLLDEKTEFKCLVFTEEALDEISVGLEHTPQKSLILQHDSTTAHAARASMDALKKVSGDRIIMFCGQHASLTSSCVSFIYGES